jgi:hypothetical protein
MGTQRISEELAMPMGTKTSERPVISFVISLIAGLVVLGGSSMVMNLSSGLPYYGGMMGGYYYGGMMGGYYGMMRGFGFGGEASTGWPQSGSSRESSSSLGR